MSSGRLTNLTAGGKDAAWSPDGRLIAYVREASYDGRTMEEVWLVELKGGAPRKLIEGGQPSWSLDSNEVLVRSRKEDKILSLAVDDPAAEPKTFFGGALTEFSTLSPDVKQIAFGQRNGITVLDRETGATLFLRARQPQASRLVSHGNWIAFDRGGTFGSSTRNRMRSRLATGITRCPPGRLTDRSLRSTGEVATRGRYGCSTEGAFS
jgi:Tol biopolymer transport system component